MALLAMSQIGAVEQDCCLLLSCNLLYRYFCLNRRVLFILDSHIERLHTVQAVYFCLMLTQCVSGSLMCAVHLHSQGGQASRPGRTDDASIEWAWLPTDAAALSSAPSIGSNVQLLPSVGDSGVLTNSWNVPGPRGTRGPVTSGLARGV